MRGSSASPSASLILGLGLLAVAVVALEGQTGQTWPFGQSAAGPQPARPVVAAPPAAEERQNPIVPVHQEPHHRQVFQYGTTRILDLQIPPGDRSWFHTHEWPVLYMTLATSRTRTQVLGEDWGASGGRGDGAGRGRAAGPSSPAGRGEGGAPAAAGIAATGARAGGPAGASPRATSTTSYAERPITHRLENIGDGLFRAMVVVNETKGDDTTSVEAAGFAGAPELTNPWFRSYRLTLAPGETTRPHRHNAPVVIFQATAGTGAGAGAMAWEFNEPGQWAFFDTGDSHEVRNLGGAPVEFLEIEVRRR